MQRSTRKMDERTSGREAARRMRPRGFVGALLAAAIGLAGSASATPITVGAGGSAPFQVDPVYFIAPSAGNTDPFGLVDAGNGVDREIGPADFGLSACGVGGGCELSITTSLNTPVHQNPQFPLDSLNPQIPQGTPTTAVPFVADSTWTVQNTSGGALSGLFLLFTSVDFTGGYPTVGVALDQNVYTIMSLDDGTSTAYYGALPIGTLGAGESKTVQVRYIVTGNLQQVGGSLVMPPFGVSGLVVPEPATTFLVGIGLTVLAFSRRRK